MEKKRVRLSLEKRTFFFWARTYRPRLASRPKTADCSVYAAANGVATLAHNKANVGAFFRNSRVLYKGWTHGYERAVAVTSRKMLAAAGSGVKGVLGPSMLYGCTMRLCASAGMPSLVAVGSANVSTPLLVSKLGGPLQALPAASLAARALPIAAHCMIEWGLFQRFKEHLARAQQEGVLKMPEGSAIARVPKTRMKAVMDGAATGALCAAAATATTVLAMSPLYGGKLLQRAVTADSAAAAAKLSMAAVRVTRIRLADSLQQGVVWFSTYEGMRAAMSIYDEKRTEQEWAEKLRAPEGFTVAPEPFTEGSAASETDAAVDASPLGASTEHAHSEGHAAMGAETPVAEPPGVSPGRFARRTAEPASARALSVWRRRESSGIDAQLSPRRKLLFARA